MKHKVQRYNIRRRRAEIAQRIREARAQRGLTQEQAARLLGCSRIKLNRVERGRADLTALEIDRLAQVLQVPVVYFFSTSA